MFNINAERPFGQIADMTIRGFDDIVLSEDLPDGFCLGGRLHDHEFVRHLRISPTKIPVFPCIYIYLQCRRFPGMSRAKHDFFQKNTKIWKNKVETCANRVIVMVCYLQYKETIILREETCKCTQR